MLFKRQRAARRIRRILKHGGASYDDGHKLSALKSADFVFYLRERRIANNLTGYYRKHLLHNSMGMMKYHRRVHFGMRKRLLAGDVPQEVYDAAP